MTAPAIVDDRFVSNAWPRLPTAVACHAFAFLALCDHATLWRTSSEWARLAHLRASAPYAATLRLPVDGCGETTAGRGVRKGDAHENALATIGRMRLASLSFVPCRDNDDGDDNDGDDAGVGKIWVDRDVDRPEHWLAPPDFSRLCDMPWIAALACRVADLHDLTEVSGLASRLERLTLDLNHCAPDLAPLGTLTRLNRLAIRLHNEPIAHPWRVGAAIRPLTRLETLEVLCTCDGYSDELPSVLSMSHDLPLFPASLTAACLYAPGRQAGPMRDADSTEGWDALLRLPLRSLSIALSLTDARFEQLLARCPRLERLQCLALVGGEEPDRVDPAHQEEDDALSPTDTPSSSSPFSSSSSLSSPSSSYSTVPAAAPTRSRHGLTHLATEHLGSPQCAARHLARLPRLESFAVDAPNGAWLALLGRISAPRLATLVFSLGSAEQPLDLACMADWNLPSLTNLALCVTGPLVTGAFEGYASLQPLSAFPNLRRLAVDQAWVTQTGAAMPRLPQLEHVRFTASPHDTGYSPDSVVSAFPTLLSAHCEYRRRDQTVTAVMSRKRAADAVAWKLRARQL
jgi:hypothetical protein